MSRAELDQIYVYTREGVDIIPLDDIEASLLPWLAEGAKAEIDYTADKSIRIYHYTLCKQLKEEERKVLLASMLPCVRVHGFALYLRSTQASAIKRIVSDLDGTLVAEELLVALSREQEFAEEMRQSTESAMLGQLAFEANFRERVARLQGITATRLEEIAYELPLASGDELFCYFAQGEDIRLDIASSNLAPYVHNLSIRLNANEYIATMPILADDDETLTGELVEHIIGAEEKRAFAQYDPHNKVTTSATMAIGDGANDLDMLAVVDHALLYTALHPSSPNIAHITTNIYFQ